MINWFRHPTVLRAAPFLRFGGLVLLITLIMLGVDGATVLALLARADPLTLVAGLVAIIGQNTMSAFRWRLTAGALGQCIGRRQAIAEYFLSQFLNMTLPAGMLGDAGRALRMRGETGLVVSGQAVFVERIMGQVALCAALTVGLALVVLLGTGAGWPPWAFYLGLSVAMTAVVSGLGVRVVRRWPGRIGRLSQTAALVFQRGVFARGIWPGQVVLSLAILACNLGGFALCALATGTVLSPIAILSVVPLVLFTMVLPLSVGGWGLREGAAAALWPVIGASSESGVAASVAFGLVILVASLPGALTLLGPVQPETSASRRKTMAGGARSCGTANTAVPADADDQATISGAAIMGTKTGNTK